MTKQRLKQLEQQMDRLCDMVESLQEQIIGIEGLLIAIEGLKLSNSSLADKDGGVVIKPIGTTPLPKDESLEAKPNLIEVPFELSLFSGIVWKKENPDEISNTHSSLNKELARLNIKKKNIKRILLEMKSEDE
jgi:hypothetical protein